MRIRIRSVLVLTSISMTSATALPESNAHGAFNSGQYRNLFTEWLDKSEDEIRSKLEGAWQQLFYGDDHTERLYYPDGDMGYVVDINNDDVRSEGMSYGMMIAVQLDRKNEFDRIWKWVKDHMHHKSGDLAGYFAWHCRRDGSRISQGPAPDGEEWFAMALLFAANRWGSGEGVLDYEAEANAILEVMLSKSDEDHDEVINMFDRDARQVRFVPYRKWAPVTDPSYHLPAFFELWGRWAAQNRGFLLNAAATSRDFFKRAAHPETGLMADYTYFDGVPRAGQGHEDFRYDAWRTLANVALDYSWFAVDPWQVEKSNRVLMFLNRFKSGLPDQFTVSGEPIDEPSTEPNGLIFMAAVAGLAGDRELAERHVRVLWEANIPSERNRYYNGMLYFLAMLQVSGTFRIHHPTGAPLGN